MEAYTSFPRSVSEERLAAERAKAMGSSVLIPPMADLPTSSEIMESFQPQGAPDMSVWSGFFKRPLEARQQALEEAFPRVSDSRATLSSGGLTLGRADLMIENCIGTCGLPIGVAPSVLLNGRHYVVPMCVEEPSVIAAASSTTKLIASCGGFFGCSTENIMIGQIQVLDLGDLGQVKAAKEKLEMFKDRLISEGNRFCPSMAQRGGGIQDIVGRFVENRHGKDVWLVVHVEVDVCEAMGANVVNTVCEGLAPSIQSLIGGRIGLRILSNLCTERRTKVCFKMPIDKLQWKGTCGELVSKKVLEAYHFADSDHFRATTNNKGIMNGIDAVAIATGQDWRAIEAGAHSFACITGRYRSLSRYWVEGDYFFGEMELPISVGTKGGAVTSHPLYKLSLEMLGNPDCQTLSQIMVAIGLAQNFAAIRALAIEGIQKGHMSLHARNIAVAADVPEHLVSAVVAKMCASHQISIDSAKVFLQECLPDTQ